MRKVILVEGKDDKAFVEALLPACEAREIVIDKLDGLNETSLTKALQRLNNEIQKNPFDKLGIVIDYDTFSNAERLNFVNGCLSSVFGIKLSAEKVFETHKIYGFDVEIACYFVGVNEAGSLDTILRQIPTKASDTADCLIKCLAKPPQISLKEHSKAWVYYYIRWDVCNAEDRTHGNQRVTLKYSLNDKNAWDLTSPTLNPLTEFLNIFLKQ